MNNILNLDHHKSAPIGIFDSGTGGLTVAKRISELLPNENIVYFGDTAHTPWGDKSIAAIQAYSIKICDVLLRHGCKILVIACNTASAAAFELVREYVGNRAHVINVIDPVVEHIGKHHANKKIGLIGTKQTIRSNAYKKRIDSLNQNIELYSLATPLLVPLIEEGFASKPFSEIVVKEYLAHPTLSEIQGLILGCTHYPIIKHHIQNFYQKPIDIIDASEIVAHALQHTLKLHKLENSPLGSLEGNTPNGITLNGNTLGNMPLNQNGVNPKKLFFVSDYSEFFASTAEIFFKDQIELQPYPLWD